MNTTQGLYKLATALTKETGVWKDMPESTHKYLPGILYLALLCVSYGGTFGTDKLVISVSSHTESYTYIETQFTRPDKIICTRISIGMYTLRGQYKLVFYNDLTGESIVLHLSQHPELKAIFKQYIENRKRRMEAC